MGRFWMWALRIVFIALGLLPFLGPLLPPLGDLIFQLGFSPFCHQNPERTLILGGDLMPVCSRCAGIYAGILAGAVLLFPSRLLHHWRSTLLTAAAAVAIEIGLQDLVRGTPFHPTRVGSGLLLGWTLSAGLLRYLWTEVDSRTTSKDLRPHERSA